jgi:maleate isomerase
MTILATVAGAADLSIEASTGFARARLGLIIPSSNRLSEPQFRRFLPADVALHVTRLRMTGQHNKPLDQLLVDVAGAAAALGDAKCDAIVFHCTANSMEHGPEGEQQILAAIRESSGATALSTAQGVVEAFRACAMKRLVLVSPYRQSHNDHEIAYLRALGFETLHDVALDLPRSDGYLAAPPSLWVETVLANQRAEADGYFLSCTNTTQIDAIPALEAELGKPVINSNQATIWAAMKRLTDKLGARPAPQGLGSLATR